MSELANLVVVGVQKAGTTSLHDYLAQHPQIRGCVPKEPGFYVHHGNHGEGRRLLSGTTPLAELPYASRAEYASTFAGVGDVRWRLDSSTPYFQSDFARQQIRRLQPAARIVICLREPVARAHSAYNWAVKEGWETAPTFEAALDLEPERQAEGYWFSYLYADTSRYAARVAAWQAAFAQCKVVLFEELRADPLAVTNDLLQWLDLDPLPALAAIAKNPSGLDANPLAARLRRFANQDRQRRSGLVKAANAMLGRGLARRLKQATLERLDQHLRPPPPLEAASRARLAPLFVDDRRALEDLLSRDLSLWNGPEPAPGGGSAPGS